MQRMINIYQHKKITDNLINVDVRVDGGNWYEIELTWEDETHPNCLIDPFYRCYRKKKYKRTQDVEKFKINFRSRKIKSHNFAKNQKWNTFNPKHHTKTYIVDTFNLYVSTWNHMFEVKAKTEEYKLIQTIWC